MRRRKPWILLLMLVAAFAVIVAACGGDDSTTAEPSAPAVPEPPPPEPEPEPPAPPPEPDPPPEPEPEPDPPPEPEPEPEPVVCEGSIAWMGPSTGEVAFLGTEQLVWAQYAVDVYNEANGTNFTLVEGDTMLDPAEGSIVAQQLIDNDAILGIVGPAGSQVVEASAPILDGNLAFISGSATRTDLTANTTTFFRTVGFDDVQGPTIADLAISLGAMKVFIVDDQESYSTGLADAMTVAFDAAGVEVVRESVSQDVTDFSALVSRIDDDVDVVVLPWQVAANGQLFADQMAEQGKTAQLIGSDGLFTDEFSAEGAYLTSFAPDITGIDDAEIQALIEQFNADGRGDLGTFGPPTYAAANALTVAMDSVCQAGGELTRESVLDAVRALNIEKSILGSPLAFNDAGDVDGAAFYIFQNQGGAKVLLP